MNTILSPEEDLKDKYRKYKKWENNSKTITFSHTIKFYWHNGLKGE